LTDCLGAWAFRYLVASWFVQLLSWIVGLLGG